MATHPKLLHSTLNVKTEKKLKLLKNSTRNTDKSERGRTGLVKSLLRKIDKEFEMDKDEKRVLEKKV